MVQFNPIQLGRYLCMYQNQLTSLNEDARSKQQQRATAVQAKPGENQLKISNAKRRLYVSKFRALVSAIASLLVIAVWFFLLLPGLF